MTHDATRFDFGADLDVDLADRVSLPLSKDLVAHAEGRLGAVRGRRQLVQALLIRLITRRGELAYAPAFGSRLHELSGAPNTPATRARAAAIVREALAGERRIASIDRVDVTVSPHDRGTLAVDVYATPAEGGAPILFGLDLGQDHKGLR